MRSIQTARLGFGPVNVNVKLYTATENHDIKFHQHHRGCLGAIRYKRLCEECGELVEFGDIVKGIESGEKLVILTDDDFASLDEEQAGEIELVQVVDRDEVDPILFEATYYLDSDNGKAKTAKATNNDKAYELFRRVLAESGQVGVVRFAMRNKTHMGVLRVYGQVLAIHTLMWSDEVRPFAALKIRTKTVELSDKEVTLARTLLDTMVGQWEPDEHQDVYQLRLAEMIESKAAGEEFTTTKRDDDEDAEDVSDLLSKLQAAIDKKAA